MPGMRRREFVSLLGGAAAAWPVAGHAQQPERIRRIGVLTQGSIHTHPSTAFRAFLSALLTLGWEDGRNLKIEWRFSEGSTEPLPRLARELVELSVDVIVTAPTEPTLAAKSATSIIPVVFVQVADPVQSGIVKGLARPEGNVTGMSALAADITGKRLALLKEMLPEIKRIAVLWHRPSKGAVLVMHEYLATGPKLGMVIVDAGVEKADEIERALRDAANNDVSLIAVIDDPVLLGYADTVIRITSSLKLPVMTQSAVYPEAGGLMSYGPDLNELYRRGAAYVDRILKGTKPSDLPVQQPEKFNLILNLKTAKALGLDVPPTLLARADEVIE
jgi:putative ABC transport system substrate-binding protein